MVPVHHLRVLELSELQDYWLELNDEGSDLPCKNAAQLASMLFGNVKYRMCSKNQINRMLQCDT